MNPIKQQQLLKKYREIEADISGLLNTFSPGDSPALILDKITHLKQTLSELSEEYEEGSVERSSVANQYAQTLRAAMDKGIAITPEREMQAGVSVTQNQTEQTDDLPDPLSQAEYDMAARQKQRQQRAQTLGSMTDYAINPLRPELHNLDFGMRRAKNGLGGVRKIHFNHRPPTVFDDVWYGNNEVVMDTLVGPRPADDMMVVTHLALHNSVQKPSTQISEQDSQAANYKEASGDVVLEIPHNEDEDDGLQQQLTTITQNQQKRQNAPVAPYKPSLQLPRF